jgi:ElaB/YqjD/DUF883 family membrane-anchored ribosome-binding protein
MGWQDAPVVDEAPKPAAKWDSAPVVESEAKAEPKSGNVALKALSLGPAGAMGAFVAEGLKRFDEKLGSAAYKAGGAVTDLTGSAGAGYATNVGIQAIPAILSGSIVGKTLSPAFEGLAKRFMQSAIKPASDDLAVNAPRAIKTMLDEGINVTPAGMAELRKRVGSLNKQVSDQIANSKELVNTSEVASHVNRAFNKFRYALVNREANLKSIADAKDEFYRAIDELDPLAQYSGSVPVQLAQKIKQATQRVLANDFGSLSGAQTEAAKDLAFGLRKGIEKAEPGVVAPNARMEELLNALSVSEKHALASLNKNPTGLSLLAENPKAAAAFMMDRSSAFKSIVARMIYAGKERVPEAAGGGATALYEGVRYKQQND